MSDRFPHAQSFDPARARRRPASGGAPFNYLRNSVKITMDAYDGTMHFYVATRPTRSSAPTRASSRRCSSRSTDVPAGPASHTSATPRSCSTSRPGCSGRYHVTDPLRFFQNDDLWTVPTGQTNEQSLPSEAYYVIMRMPGESDAEFLLLQPMIPVSRPNMIAWVAARNDRPSYGTTRVYRFPADTTIFGPAQIEARIDQDPIISEQFTLWRNSGSDVIRGNLIVVPVGDSLLYLQPIYLQSTGSAFPEFRRIVVASPRQVVWGTNLAEALRLLLVARRRGRRRADARPDARPPAPGQTPGPSADADARSERPAADRRRRAHRLREPPLRAGPGRAARRRLRPLRRGDRPGRGRAPAPRRARARALASPPASPSARAMSPGAALGASLLAVLADPATWALGLLAFLLRGGVVARARADRDRALGGRAGQRLRPGPDRPRPRRHAHGRPRPRSAERRWSSSCWLVVGGWLAAAAEAEAIRRVAADEEVGDGRPTGAPPRRVAAGGSSSPGSSPSCPCSWPSPSAGSRIVLVSYRELTVPVGRGGSRSSSGCVRGRADALALIVVDLAGRRSCVGAPRGPPDLALRGAGIARGARADAARRRRPPSRAVLVGTVVPARGSARGGPRRRPATRPARRGARLRRRWRTTRRPLLQLVLVVLLVGPVAGRSGPGRPGLRVARRRLDRRRWPGRSGESRATRPGEYPAAPERLAR